MPMNPMQRRARNSFLIGFLIALVVMALVVIFLLQRIKNLNDAKEKLEALQKDVYVASEDMASGYEFTYDKYSEDFRKEKIQTTMNVSDNVFEEKDFEYYDEDGELITKTTEDGTEIKKTYVLKIDVPAGSVVTKDMVYEKEEQISSDVRLQEFNMILLPSQLKNGDYIDIRYSLPTGENYIVLSKKKVIYTTQTGIWLNLTEDEMLTIENAIVESYRIAGSKLYALEYVEPGMQNKAVETYAVSQKVHNMIITSPNVLQEAKEALAERYNNQAHVDQRNFNIEPFLINQETSALQSSVQSGIKAEQSVVASDRESYVKSLEGTEDIGVGSN